MPGVHYFLHAFSALALAVLGLQYLRLSHHLQSLQHEPGAETVKDGEQTEGGEGRDASLSSVVSEVGSSVWCWGKTNSDRMCRFRNLCYLPERDSFVFFHANASFLHGLPEDRFAPALVDLSSVRDHGTQYFNYADLSSDSAASLLRDAVLVKRTTVLMNRFHPDNLMHVLHDDLLPLYSMLTMISGGTQHHHQSALPFPVQLVLTEGWQPAVFANLYQLFSAYNPIYRSQITSPLCFHDAFVGLPKGTTWYQYGFHEPQGPLPDMEATGSVIRQFAQYVEARLGMQDADKESNLGSDPARHAVLLSRKHNRLILNEMDLAVELARKLQLKVVNVANETHSVRQMIALVRTASLLIGMHGSLFALSIFLPRGALVVELFPFAVNPDHYTPYKTLAQLPGMTLNYRSWRNTRMANTRTHPEAPRDLGGIAHLPADQQDAIKSREDVPLHLCCSDPDWLFRIYQDTVVDVAEIMEVVESGLKAGPGDEQRAVVKSRIHPSYVQDLSCGETSGLDLQLTVTWEPPWNVRYITTPTPVQYEIWLQEVGNEDYIAWIVHQTSHVFDSGLAPHTLYHVWVRCLLDNTNILGPFNHQVVQCQTN